LSGDGECLLLPFFDLPYTNPPFPAHAADSDVATCNIHARKSTNVLWPKSGVYRCYNREASRLVVAKETSEPPDNLIVTLEIRHGL